MQIKSADDVRRGIAREGQLGSHMALVLGAEKNDSVLGFIASPKEVSSKAGADPGGGHGGQLTPP